MESKQQTTPISQQLIELRQTRLGDQKAYIVGTRISVQNIYVSHELQGLTPDEMLGAYPHLNLAQIHAALAYYYENPDQVRNLWRREQAFADTLAADQGGTPFTELRHKLLSGKDGFEDPLSS